MYGPFKKYIQDNIETILLWKEKEKLPIHITKADIPCLLTGCSARTADGVHWMDDEKWINPTSGKHRFMSLLHNPFDEAFTREKILSGWAKVRGRSLCVRSICADDVLCRLGLHHSHARCWKTLLCGMRGELGTLFSRNSQSSTLNTNVLPMRLLSMGWMHRY